MRGSFHACTPVIWLKQASGMRSTVWTDTPCALPCKAATLPTHLTRPVMTVDVVSMQELAWRALWELALCITTSLETRRHLQIPHLHRYILGDHPLPMVHLDVSFLATCASILVLF